jgi:hypothetical protein
MSEEKVLEMKSGGELKTSDATNKFAIGIGNLLTRSNPERAIGDAIDELVTQRISWENNELTNANEALYGLLQHCYSLNNAMSGADSTAKSLKKGLANYIKDKNYKFTESTPLITKVVKCVFGVNRRRVNAYSTALRVAISEKKSVIELPKFFKDHGGIEEVRRKASSTKVKTLDEKVKLGRTVLENEALATVHSDKLNEKFSTTSLEEGVVLLATREDDGSFAIRQMVQTNAAVKSALAACSSIGIDKEKNQKILDENLAIEEARLAAQAALKAA